VYGHNDVNARPATGNMRWVALVSVLVLVGILVVECMECGG